MKFNFPAGMAPSGSGSSSGTLPSITGLIAVQPLQFTVNPLTKSVTVQLLN